MKAHADIIDLIFRVLFCFIFIGLGGEHLMSDQLIQRLMPDWVPAKRLVSVGCGVWLVTWGGLLLVGWHLRWAAIALGLFVALVTVFVHVPGVLEHPTWLAADCQWIWDILQRTNLVKNLCLLGVCIQLLQHDVGRYSLQHYLGRR